MPINTKSDPRQAARVFATDANSAASSNMPGGNRTMKKSVLTIGYLAVVALATTGNAQVATSQPSVAYEDGPDGVRYQITRNVVQRSIPTTEYQAREQKVYRPQLTTEYQSYQHTYYTPVTEYQIVPRLHHPFNILGPSYWSHEYVPVTRWEARPATVQIPVSRTNWVEGTQVAQVPVTTYRTTQEEEYHKVAIGVTPTGVAPGANVAGSAPTASVASRPIGGQQLQSDPPRSQSPWATSAGSDGFRR
jgi:hypothetical protein